MMTDKVAANWAILDEDGKILGRYLTEEDADTVLRWGSYPTGVAVDWVEAD